MNFGIVLATDIQGGIGKNNNLPWPTLKKDMKRFRNITKDSYIIMGRNTADSLPGQLKNRTHIILTSNPDYTNDKLKDFVIKESLDDALLYVRRQKDGKNVYVIGGKRLYEEAIKHKRCNRVYMTKVLWVYDCDVSINSEFTSYLDNFEIDDMKVVKDNVDVDLLFVDYSYNNFEEIKYLQLGNKILNDGDVRKTRNATTYSIFSDKLVFDLSNGLPILTSKFVPFRIVLEELLFFLRGDTNTTSLMDANVNIWKGNTCKEFLENNGKDLEEWDMGPMYGYQWRNFNGKGIDQIEHVIDQLINNPSSRRIIMTTFNPEQVEQGVLYPCHGIVTQFYVRDDYIDLQTYQRSADYFLGLPFNITSYSILLHIIISIVNHNSDKTYRPGKVITVLGDVHIYDTHIDAVKKQLDRVGNTMKFPTLTIDGIESLDDIMKATTDNFVLNDYARHPSIKADMVA